MHFYHNYNNNISVLYKKKINQTIIPYWFIVPDVLAPLKAQSIK